MSKTYQIHSKFIVFFKHTYILSRGILLTCYLPLPSHFIFWSSIAILGPVKVLRDTCIILQCLKYKYMISRFASLLHLLTYKCKGPQIDGLQIFYYPTCPFCVTSEFFFCEIKAVSTHNLKLKVHASINILMINHINMTWSNLSI